jgi:uncharacterized membrane protein (UPF0136 family)
LIPKNGKKKGLWIRKGVLDMAQEQALPNNLSDDVPESTVEMHESPHIKLGLFKLRIPFVHYKWQMPETIQAFFMFSGALAGIPLVMDAFPWVSFDVAWTILFFFTLVFWLTGFLGDPSCPGFITAAIPVVLLYVKSFPEGAERVWAMVSIHLVLTVLCLITGPTGLADWLNTKVPVSIRSGIVFGAGISAFAGELGDGGRFSQAPVGIFIATVLSFYLLWSVSFKLLQQKRKIMKSLGKYGYVPAFLVGAIVALIVGEVPMPVVEWRIFVPQIQETFATATIFGYGFPPLSFLLGAIPTAFVVYVILFGDWMIIDSLRKDAMATRPNELIDFSISRSTVIVAFRNLWSGILAPFPPMPGPLWTGVTVSIYERYKSGKENMDSIFGGFMSFQHWWPILVFLVPLVSLLRPFLIIATSPLLFMQGFACTFISMNMSKNAVDLGIAGCIGVVLWRFGAVHALLLGAILWLILAYVPKNLKQE